MMIKINRRTMTRYFIVYLIFALLFIPVLSYASWLDKWYTQKTSSGPTYYDGQQRGYWTAGSYSARVPVGMVYPISFSPPRLKMGCGGIDFYGGGVSLMNYKYLVTKLQGILSSAATVAFDMALKVLCPICSETLKSIEAIANQLNSAGLDSCKAGKAIVSYAADKIDDAFVSDQDISDRMTDYQNDQGLYDSYTGYSQAVQGVSNNVGSMAGKFGASSAGSPDDTSTSASAGTGLLTSGCPANYQAIFTKKGSFLDNLANQQGVSTDLAAVVRGVIGDFYLVSDQSQVMPIAACSSAYSTLDDIVDGQTEIRGPGWFDQCTQISNGSISLRQMVTSNIQNIADNMANRNKLTTSQLDLIKNTPLPLALWLKSGVATQDANTYIGVMADITSKAMAYKFIKDVHGALYQMLQYAESAQAQGSTGSNPTYCKPPANLTAITKEMNERLRNWEVSLKSQIQQVYSEYSMLESIVSRYQEKAAAFNGMVALRFGRAVASRATLGR
ncbi:MAG: conjugal transfer protein TraH [Syntrophaceae bacterium]